MASTVWKGYISFGLISVPVRMYVAAREEHIGFNQIHKTCGTRIKQQLYCPLDERVVERNEIEKGYPVGDGSYVLVSPNELKALEAESSETMAIQQFVELDEVDPIYYETSYYTVAEEPGRRAYSLMMQAMQKLKLGAIAKLTLHQREQVVIIRPYEHGLILHTLYYPEEVREIPEYGDQSPLELQDAEVKLAEQFMGALRAPFHPDAFHNTYQERVEQLIESKGRRRWRAGAADKKEADGAGDQSDGRPAREPRQQRGDCFAACRRGTENKDRIREKRCAEAGGEAAQGELMRC